MADQAIERVTRSQGRPEIGRPVNIRLGDDLLAAVDSHAVARGINRAEAIRQLVKQGMRRGTGGVEPGNGKTAGDNDRPSADEPVLIGELPRHYVSVAGIVVDSAGRILTIKRADNGHWEPPGGVLEHGETFEEGVRREVLEETGVTVQVERLSGVYRNSAKGVVALVYRCTPVAGEAHRTEEACEARWMTAEAAMAAMSPVFAVRVRDALHDCVQSRTHDGVTVMS